jgi:hypothetical protein
LANLLIINALDPQVKIPELKACAVQVLTLYWKDHQTE